MSISTRLKSSENKQLFHDTTKWNTMEPTNERLIHSGSKTQAPKYHLSWCDLSFNSISFSSVLIGFKRSTFLHFPISSNWFYIQNRPNRICRATFQASWKWCERIEEEVEKKNINGKEEFNVHTFFFSSFVMYLQSPISRKQHFRKCFPVEKKNAWNEKNKMYVYNENHWQWRIASNLCILDSYKKKKNKSHIFQIRRNSVFGAIQPHRYIPLLI